MTTRRLQVMDLGTRSYGSVLAHQRELAAARIRGEIEDDLLLLVEHPPVVTLGRTSKAAHLVASAELLHARGVEVFEVERGGDVTFHGPGQLVGYPIFDLRRHRQDLHWYLRQVEAALIRAAGMLGLAAERNPGYTGVWTSGKSAVRSPQSAVVVSAVRSPQSAVIVSAVRSPQSAVPVRKLASIGVHARDWVTWHGFALNVTTDLSYFDLIVPCGIDGVVMTTLARELGGDPGMDTVKRAVIRAFGEVFELAVRREAGERRISGYGTRTGAAIR